MTSPGDGLIEAIAEAVALKLERMNSTSQRLMEIEEAAKYLGMTAPALRQKAAAGEVPVVRIDNKLRFDRHELTVSSTVPSAKACEIARGA